MDGIRLNFQELVTLWRQSPELISTNELYANTRARAIARTRYFGTIEKTTVVGNKDEGGLKEGFLIQKDMVKDLAVELDLRCRL
jgi:hypothetical protein